MKIMEKVATNSRHAHYHKQSGFTLMESLVYLTIVSVIVGMGVVSYPEIIASQHKAQTKAQFEADLIRSKNLALRMGGRAVYVANGDGSAYTVGYDLVSYSGTPTYDVAVYTTVLPSSVRLTASGSVVFGPNGLVVDAGTGKPVTRTIIFTYQNVCFAEGTLMINGRLKYTGCS